MNWIHIITCLSIGACIGVFVGGLLASSKVGFLYDEIARLKRRPLNIQKEQIWNDIVNAAKPEGEHNLVVSLSEVNRILFSDVEYLKGRQESMDKDS